MWDEGNLALFNTSAYVYSCDSSARNPDESLVRTGGQSERGCCSLENHWHKILSEKTRQNQVRKVNVQKLLCRIFSSLSRRSQLQEFWIRFRISLQFFGGGGLCSMWVHNQLPKESPGFYFCHHPSPHPIPALRCFHS